MNIIILTQFCIISMQALSTKGHSNPVETQLSPEISPIVSPKDTLKRVIRSNTKAIMEQNKICAVLAKQINSVENLLIIKHRYPVLFDHCKLKIKATKNIMCKRFGWKSRSVHC